MTNAADMKNRKQEFNNHCGEHKCKAGECEERKQRWLDYMSAAERLETHDSDPLKYVGI